MGDSAEPPGRANPPAAAEGVAPLAAGAAKPALRARILRARAARSAADRERAAQMVLDLVLGLPELPEVGVVLGYVASATEPGTGLLLRALRDRGCRPLVPLARPGEPLGWAEWTGPRSLRPGPLGVAEPLGAVVGDESVRTASLVLVPALAVDRDGFRLGRGGGYYDRFLASDAVHPHALTVAVVFADEVMDRLPRDPHDRPVRAAVSDAGLLRFG